MLGLGITEILAFVLLGVIFVIKYGGSKKNLPPGPRGLPIVGSVFQLTNNAHLQMAKWAKEYGKIYKFKMGTNTAIVISDIKIVKEMLSDTNFSTRPHMPIIQMLVGGCYGIVNTNGHAWEEQRRWNLRKLRDFGFGKTSMEGLIMEEVNEVVDILKDTREKPLVVDRILDLAVLNALWTLMNGERCAMNDPKIRGILDVHREGLEAVLNSGLGFAPWLKYIFPNSQKKIEILGEKFLKFCKDAVTSHWDTWEKERESKDLIDEYIAEIKKTTDPGSSFYGEMGRKNLIAVVSDLIQAGSETTSHTLTWMLCYLTQYPEVQHKIHEELDSVVGSRAEVGLADKLNLPYCEAMIQETLRYSALVATGGTHSCIEDKVIGGYVIPKDCWIFTNIYYIHHDPAVWGDPENFRPERFLKRDMKTGKLQAVKHEALIPFQYGRRQCLGESLARDTLFLFAANILRQFNVTRVEKEVPQIEAGGVVLVPKMYHFVFRVRQ